MEAGAVRGVADIDVAEIVVGAILGCDEATARGLITVIVRARIVVRADHQEVHTCAALVVADILGAAVAVIATALGLMDDKDSIPAIQELVKQKGDPDLRKAASISLGLLRDTEAVEILRQVISESTSSKAILGAATVALGYIGDRSAVEMLVNFVENPDDKYQDVTRAFATVALGFLGDKDDIPLLSKIHEHSNYLAQTEALREVLSIL